MPNFFLDLRTLSFSLMLVTGLMACVMVFVWRAQKTYPGTIFWVMSNFAAAVGFLLIGMRGIVPDFVSILIGNTLAAATLALALEGNRKFLALPSTHRRTIAIMAIYTALQIVFTYIAPDVIMRIIVASATAMLLAWLCYRAFEERSEQKANIVYRTVGLTFLMFAALMFVRIVTTYLFSNIIDFYAPDWIQSIFFMVFLVFATTWSFNYVVLNNERLNEELRATESDLVALAATDFLTGLSNKRAFIDYASTELKRSRRYNIPTAIVLFDLDNFKLVNDTFGHAGGDKVLKEIGELCKNLTRQHDHIARLGGEEFGLLLTHTDVNGGFSVAEGFRKEFEKLEIPYAGQSINITSSFGVTELRASDTLESLLDRADTSLYKAKALGRNTVVSDGGHPGLRLLSQA